MSSYRDDMNDTAVASDQVLMRLRSVAESTARATSVILSTLALLTVDAAVASDQTHGRVISLVTDSAAASGEALGGAHLRDLAVDSARAGDGLHGTLRLVLQDAARASDQLLAAQRGVSADAARAASEVLDHRTSRALVQDAARAKDALVFRVRDDVHDGAVAADTLTGRLKARALVLDGAQAGGELLGAAGQSALLTDRARATSAAFGALRARDLVTDWPITAHDELLTPGLLLGQVWTAAAGEWAMSRWPLGLSGLAVIDGALYATTPAGVFALDGQDERIEAELRTGAIDMTGDRLGRPHAAYLEYELAGLGAAASIAVTTTQTGMPATYTYPLALRPNADALTNARALLGRGLRGRHFAYTLKLTGSRAYINDWGVLVAPTNRRI